MLVLVEKHLRICSVSPSGRGEFRLQPEEIIACFLHPGTRGDAMSCRENVRACQGLRGGDGASVCVTLGHLQRALAGC